MDSLIDISMLLAQMSLDEKLALIAGESTWRTAAIERLGIPCLKVSDGPSGARGEVFGEGVPAAFIPSGVSLGATWDESLLFEIGQLLAEETKSKSASVILAPTMCIHRHPLGGRNFESFSEDPILTGKLASAHVRGVQSKGIANEQDTKRFRYNAQISARALREVYLRPFQMVARQSDPWCMMTAYNKVNGNHCDMSKELLTNIARSEWNWQGVFMSDWGGTNSSAESINAGLDLEMPGPPSKRSKVLLKPLLKQGAVDLKCVDKSALRVLKLLKKAGRFRGACDTPEYCRNDVDTQQLLLRAATEGIVLLKNESNALPLKPSQGMKKLAILGPNAQRVVAGGGGSAYIKAPYWTSVYQSLKDRLSGYDIGIAFAPGARMNRYLPTMPPSIIMNPDTGSGGAAVDWFLGHEFSGKAVATTHIDDLYYMTFGVVPAELGLDRDTDFCYRVRGTLKPTTTGEHKFSFASIGPATLYINGKRMLQLSGALEEKGTLFFTYGSDESITSLALTAGQIYQIKVEYHSHDRQKRSDLQGLLDPMEDKFQGIRIGYEEPDRADLPTEAANLASTCDAAVVVVGRDKEWETEGHDIPIFELPGEQVQLIQQVSAVCPRTIVLVQAGTPVRMEPWIDSVDAVLYTWYQGQELGNAAADVLIGATNPSGRLPITFPRRIEDCPAYPTFPGEQSEVPYSEGIYVGYKWWDLLKIKPHFPIGFGLSYNNFSVLPAGPASQSSLHRGSRLTLPVRIRHDGGSDLSGRQTVICWLSQREPNRLSRPVKQICGFAKSRALRPGEEHVVQVDVDYHAFGVFDPQKGRWVIDAGITFDISLGTDALSTKIAWSVTAPEEILWIH